MSALDALLGKVFSAGVEIELGGGLDFTDGIVAARNDETNRVEISLDVSASASVDYDNTTSGLAADTVQEALDEIALGWAKAPAGATVAGNVASYVDTSGNLTDSGFAAADLLDTDAVNDLIDEFLEDATVISDASGYIGIGAGGFPGTGTVRLASAAGVHWLCDTGTIGIDPTAPGVFRITAGTGQYVALRVGSSDVALASAAGLFFAYVAATPIVALGPVGTTGAGRSMLVFGEDAATASGAAGGSVYCGGGLGDGAGANGVWEARDAAGTPYARVDDDGFSAGDLTADAVVSTTAAGLALHEHTAPGAGSAGKVVLYTTDSESLSYKTESGVEVVL